MTLPTNKRLEREQETVLKMISLYCRDQHESSDGDLCEDCQKLADYAFQNIARCPFGADKPTCANGRVYCYRPEMRQQIRQVMRYAGPRMLFQHPYLTLIHFVDGLHKSKERK